MFYWSILFICLFDYVIQLRVLFVDWRYGFLGIWKGEAVREGNLLNYCE